VGVTEYLANKSAIARLPLMDRGLVSICGVTELELLFSARNIQERSRMKQQIDATLNAIHDPDHLWKQASESQGALTEKGSTAQPRFPI
jgi:predicted nucleic acid-binding protein